MNVKLLRLQLGLSQSQVARAAHVSQAMVSIAERDPGAVTKTVLEKILGALAKISSGEDPPPRYVPKAKKTVVVFEQPKPAEETVPEVTPDILEKMDRVMNSMTLRQFAKEARVSHPSVIKFRRGGVRGSTALKIFRAIIRLAG